jgi:formate-nitrite transporter family protein
MQPSMRIFLRVVRLWGVVFVSDILGAFLFATIIAHAAVFPPAIQQSFLHLSQLSMNGAFGLTLVKGIFAGWQTELMVWLLSAAEATKLQVINILTYLIGLGEFAHIIAGPVDAF